MGSAVFQAMKIGLALILIAIIVVSGFVLFYIMQYTQFSNQTNRMIQEVSCVPPNIRGTFHNNKYNVNNPTKETEYKQSSNHNERSALSIGNRINALEKDYGYTFTIVPYNNDDSKFVPYGHLVAYQIQVRIPLNGVPARNSDGTKMFKQNRLQYVASNLNNDTTENSNQ